MISSVALIVPSVEEIGSVCGTHQMALTVHFKISNFEDGFWCRIVLSGDNDRSACFI